MASFVCLCWMVNKVNGMMLFKAIKLLYNQLLLKVLKVFTLWPGFEKRPLGTWSTAFINSFAESNQVAGFIPLDLLCYWCWTITGLSGPSMCNGFSAGNALMRVISGAVLWLRSQYCWEAFHERVRHKLNPPTLSPPLPSPFSSLLYTPHWSLTIGAYGAEY